MDSRTALKADTTLRFSDKYEYTIIDAFARGGSSIVYNAFYIDNLGERKTVRIKECYPFKCNLQRKESGELSIPAAERKLFAEAKRKMQRAYHLGNEFFSTDGLTNLTANTHNIFEANNTLYIVYAYAQGQELSYERYPAVKDSIAAVKSAANAICRIHAKGFLYLDIKPSNILTLEGTAELVQLFDFDTVVSISDMAALDDKISYTRGFAALELQSGDYRHIGRHTDIYGIGALLFYMIFNRIPDAFDCEADAEYDFSQSKLSGSSYQDTLLFRLTDFFHHTLADYYLDRYSNMETAAEKLSELQALADLSSHYIINSKISAPGFFIGRQKETEWIAEKLVGIAECSFIAGMGGIGKSTLIRHCLKRCSQKIDSILYLDFLGTIEKTICDDYALQINGVHKDKTETDAEYFDRKLGVLRKLGKNKTCVLVIDNYTGDDGEAFSKLLQLDWHIFFLTRDRFLSQGYDTLEIGPISDCEMLLQLFSKYIGRELNEEERRSAAAIIQNVAGHTLVIELIAKQIGSPICGISLAQAAEIVADKGFASIGPERIGYLHDNVLYRKTIRQIIAGLFAAETLSDTQCVIMKTLSLFGRSGISASRLCEILSLKSKDDLNALYHQGWIYVNDTIITIHPVIEEVLCDWELTEPAQNSVSKVFRYLSAKLKAEAHKTHGVQENAPGKPYRCGGCAGVAAADRGETDECLRLAMAVLDGAKRLPGMYPRDLYKELLYYAILTVPYENERFILEKSEEYISLFGHGSERMLLQVCRILLEVLYDRGEFDEAESEIQRLRALISGNSSPEITGQFYYMLAGFYDAVLNGAYDAQTSEEAQLVRLILKSANKAIRCLSHLNGDDFGIFLGECCRMKALILIRSGIGKKRQVRAVLKKVQRQINKYAPPNSELARDYDLTMAWYYTYLKEDYQQVCSYLSKACEITDIIAASELVKIDYQLCPMANIMLEWQQYDKAEMYLLRCISMCSDHLEIAAYARRQVELLGHLLEVYLHAEKYGKCRIVIDQIDEKIKQIGSGTLNLNAEDYVPEEIREFVAANQPFAE